MNFLNNPHYRHFSRVQNSIPNSLIGDLAAPVSVIAVISRPWLEISGLLMMARPRCLRPTKGFVPRLRPGRAERGSNSRATWLPRLHFREMKTGGVRDKRRVARANKPLGRARIQIKLESDMTRSSGASMILSPSRGGRLSWKTIGNLWERAFRNDFSKLNWEMVLEMVLD